MTEFASTECRQHCNVLTGPPVHFVSKAMEEEDGVNTVALVGVLSGGREDISSVALHDIGDNDHYLEAVRRCPGPIACGGFLKKQYDCGAMVGDQHKLSDYRY